MCNLTKNSLTGLYISRGIVVNVRWIDSKSLLSDIDNRIDLPQPGIDLDFSFNKQDTVSVFGHALFLIVFSGLN